MENKKLIPPAFRPIHDTDVTTWHLPDGAIARLGQGLLQDIDFSNDGEYLCLASGIGFWIYDTETLTPRALWGTETGKMQVATFSYDAQWIATGDIDGYLRVWDTQNGQCITQIDWGSTRQYKKISCMSTFHWTVNVCLLPVLDTVLSMTGAQTLMCLSQVLPLKIQS